MRARRLVRFTAAIQATLLLATLVLPALAAAATIQTDLFVYQDGDTVNVTGVDYGPNEVVDFVTTDPDGTVVDSGSAASGDQGSVAYSFTLHATIPGLYTVVGTGATSGYIASTQFDPHTVTITSAAVGAKRTVAGAINVPVTINVKCSGTSGSGACTAISSLKLTASGPGGPYVLSSP